MKTAGVIGKKIVRVEQFRCYDEYGGLVWDVQRIVLEDDSWITFSTHPMDDTPIVTAMHRKRKKARRKP